MNTNDKLKIITEIRKAKNFLTFDEMQELAKRNNIFLDPFSILISKDVVIGDGNVFYPNVILQINENGSLHIGNYNVLFPNTLVLSNRGKIKIGNYNQFGDGGCCIKANMDTAVIVIENNCRFLNGPVIVGKTVLESGSQIIGSITVQDSHLYGGEDYLSRDPDLRAAVLKGFGLARNIRLEKGKVIQAFGLFDHAKIENQSVYHQKKA